MEELKIYEFQAKRIEDTLRLVANLLKSQSRETCLDRDVMRSWEMIKNVIDKNPDKRTNKIKDSTDK